MKNHVIARKVFVGECVGGFTTITVYSQNPEFEFTFEVYSDEARQIRDDIQMRLKAVGREVPTQPKQQAREDELTQEDYDAMHESDMASEAQNRAEREEGM